MLFEEGVEHLGGKTLQEEVITGGELLRVYRLVPFLLLIHSSFSLLLVYGLNKYVIICEAYMGSKEGTEKKLDK